MLTDQRIVQLRSDGLALSPVAYGGLLARLAETSGIAPDDYSRGGVVEELEARMAALLGKEAAVFMPSGTLANHLALRLHRLPLSQRHRLRTLCSEPQMTVLTSSWLQSHLRQELLQMDCPYLEVAQTQAHHQISAH